MIGRASGVVHRYFLPHLTPEGQHVLRCRPQVGQSCHWWKVEGGGLITAFAFTAQLAARKPSGLPRLSSTSLPVTATVPILLPAFTHLARAQMLALNCNMSKMSVIDINGVLSFFDLAAKGGAPGTQVRHAGLTSYSSHLGTAYKHQLFAL